MLHEQMFRLSLGNVLWLTLMVPSAMCLVYLRNAALNKPTEQSHPWEGYPASAAVDGDRLNGRSNSQFKANPYWEVDLGDIYVIDHIEIHARECYDFPSVDTINEDMIIQLSVDGSGYTTICDAGRISGIIYTCRPDGRSLGRWVRLQSEDELTHIALCEVEVMVKRDMFKSVPSVKGTGTVLQTRPVVSELQCAYYCSRMTDCNSVNVVNRPTGVECELLGSDTLITADGENITFWRL